MKISIITPTLNSEETIAINLSSVLGQSYKNIEHIFVDGGSSDKTIEIIKKYPFRNKKIFLFKKKKLYASINYGISKANGDIIAILNSDDMYNNNDVIKNIVKKAKAKKAIDIFIGDTVYFDNKSFKKITRFYSVNNFRKKMLKYGLMPSHTGSFIRKDTYKSVGHYNENFKIASDFDFFLRALKIHNKSFCYVNLLITRMRTGGVSGKNIKSYLTSTFEIIRSFKLNGLSPNYFYILARIPIKIKQFIFIKKKKLNEKFHFPKNNFYINELYDFTIYKNLQKINFNDNFILSALNLSYLGSLYKGEIKYNKNLIHWPDGIFSATIKRKLKKIPGRDLLNKIKLPNSIKKIIVLGNLSNNGKNYLLKKFKKEIYHENLSYGNVKEIYTKLKKRKMKKDELIFLTLPTPKQEIFAELISKNNKYFKIICIGGSIAIASGDETEVPKFMNNFEWLWRLKYETKRRLLRLIKTFFNYYFTKLFSTKKYLGIRIV